MVHKVVQEGYEFGKSPQDYMTIAIKRGFFRGEAKVDSSFSFDEHDLTVLETELDLPMDQEWNCNKTNPSPLLLSNGTLLLAYRSSTCELDGKAVSQQVPQSLRDDIHRALQRFGERGREALGAHREDEPHQSLGRERGSLLLQGKSEGSS